MVIIIIPETPIAASPPLYSITSPNSRALSPTSLIYSTVIELHKFYSISSPATLKPIRPSTDPGRLTFSAAAVGTTTGLDVVALGDEVMKVVVKVRAVPGQHPFNNANPRLHLLVVPDTGGTTTVTEVVADSVATGVTVVVAVATLLPSPLGLTKMVVVVVPLVTMGPGTVNVVNGLTEGRVAVTVVVGTVTTTVSVPGQTGSVRVVVTPSEITMEVTWAAARPAAERSWKARIFEFEGVSFRRNLSGIPQSGFADAWSKCDAVRFRVP
jgi:hypothetical protein